MSRIFEAAMDEKQEALEFNEKEMLALEKYIKPIEEIRKNPFPKINTTGYSNSSNLPDNAGSLSFWLD